jgi:membrane associated rhomboid family serine protease
MYPDLRDAAHPDPARSHANFLVALKLSLVFVAVLWLVHVLLSDPTIDRGMFGIRPRQWQGLLGILTAPLVHADYGHLISNSAPLVVLGTAILSLYPRSSRIVLPAVYLGSGTAVWLFARGATHIGASGLVYGMFAYLLASGLLRRDRRALGAALLVCFLYGALIWGVLPIQVHVSWETHLAGAMIGASLALPLRGRDLLPRRQYSWERAANRDEEVPQWWLDEMARREAIKRDEATARRDESKPQDTAAGASRTLH